MEQKVETSDALKKAPTNGSQAEVGYVVEHDVNASGHKQELDRQFSLLSICAVGICTGNAWAAIGGSIVLAMYNGGPPGVIYELIVCDIFYWMISFCIAELASAIPSSAGVYHWATVTSGKYGRPTGFFAGWWNFLAWNFGAASMTSLLANQVLGMWGLYREEYVWQRWHTFIVYLIITWLCVFTVMFANRALPSVSNIGLYWVIGGFFITVLVCAIMPSTTGKGHASTASVWTDWDNQTGYSSDGFVFLAGMLNAAFSVGVPDCVSHLAEELPHPRINIPKAIFAQMAVGFVTAFFFLIAIFYSINDMDALYSSTNTFPLVEIYKQATNSRGGSLGLIFMIFFPTACNNIGAYVTAGRTLWTLGRDGATPFSNFVGRISPTHKNPLNATFCCGIVSTILGCIYVGSTTAFNAIVGSFVILITLSYLCAILPHLITNRRHVVPGPFWMPDAVFKVVAAVSCAYIVVFIVIFCFPAALPVTPVDMNYSSVISGGLTILVAIYWFWKGNRGYEGPKALLEESMRMQEAEFDKGSITKTKA